MKYVMYQSFVYEVNGKNVRKVSAAEASQLEAPLTSFDQLTDAQQEAVMEAHYTA